MTTRAALSVYRASWLSSALAAGTRNVNSSGSAVAAGARLVSLKLATRHSNLAACEDASRRLGSERDSQGCFSQSESWEQLVATLLVLLMQQVTMLEMLMILRAIRARPGNRRRGAARRHWPPPYMVLQPTQGKDHEARTPRPGQEGSRQASSGIATWSYTSARGRATALVVG